MEVPSSSRRHPGGDKATRTAYSGEDVRKRAIARAVWTEIHWLMPRDRTVTITVDGADIAVAFGPPGSAVRSASH